MEKGQKNMKVVKFVVVILILAVITIAFGVLYYSTNAKLRDKSFIEGDYILYSDGSGIATMKCDWIVFEDDPFKTNASIDDGKTFDNMYEYFRKNGFIGSSEGNLVKVNFQAQHSKKSKDSEDLYYIVDDYYIVTPSMIKSSTK